MISLPSHGSRINYNFRYCNMSSNDVIPRFAIFKQIEMKSINYHPLSIFLT